MVGLHSSGFASLLRGYRLAAGLSQEQLAERAGLSARAISDLERGIRRAPHRPTLTRLAQALALGQQDQLILESAIFRVRRKSGSASTPANGASIGQAQHLPAPLTSFVGRQTQLAHAVRWLAGGPPSTRLLTLIGTPGVGKTRLALEVARQLAGMHVFHNVRVVELAPVTDPAAITPAIGAALGLTGEPGRPFAEVLLDALRTQQLLLVLDNCEHLLHACADVVHQILRWCAGVSVLATSRQALGIVGETTQTVPPLALPRPGAARSVEALAQCESVCLFVDRAGSADSEFGLNPSTAATVGRICHQMAGIPLALELAAARVRVLSVEQIATRLDKDFRLLTGSRTAPPRHQTLEAALSWSYELLGESEQQLFARLAVFAGGWSLEAAEAVCAGGEVAADRVVELLAQLVEQSLVAAESTPDGEKRYRFLEPLRQFALEKLRARGEERLLRMRHFAWFAHIAEESERFIRLTPGTAASKSGLLMRMLRDFDNLRTAWQWTAFGDGDVRAGLQMAAALLSFHYTYGSVTEGRAWLRALLDRDAGGEPSLARGQALSAAAVLANAAGDVDAMRALTTEYLELPESSTDTLSMAAVWHAVGSVTLHDGDVVAARTHLLRALALARQSGEVTAPIYIVDLGRVAELAGDLDEAQRVYQEALAEARASDLGPVAALALDRLASLLWSKGQAAQAEALYQQGVTALDYRPVVALPQVATSMLVALGYLALERQDVQHALERFNDAVNCAALFGGRTLAAALNGLGIVLVQLAAQRGQSLDRALGVLGAAASLRAAGRDHGSLTDTVAARTLSVLEATLDQARAAVGSARVEQHLQAGYAMAPDQALAEARAAAENAADPG